MTTRTAGAARAAGRTDTRPSPAGYEPPIPLAAVVGAAVGLRTGRSAPDTDHSGNLIETFAVQNRLVIIQPAGQRCG